jgi:hypothetical protein
MKLALDDMKLIYEFQPSALTLAQRLVVCMELQMESDAMACARQLMFQYGPQALHEQEGGVSKYLELKLRTFPWQTMEPLKARSLHFLALQTAVRDTAVQETFEAQYSEKVLAKEAELLAQREEEAKSKKPAKKK